MDIAESRGGYATQEKISNAILILLLLVRLADQYLPLWIFGSNTPDWFSQWYAGVSYILTATIVWLNRHRLAALNIDRPFIMTLLLGGVLWVFYLASSVGIFIGITVGLIYWAYQTNQLVFKNPVPYPKGTGLLLLFTILLALAPVLLFRLTLNLNFQKIVTTFLEILVVQLGGIIFEEVLFRGALWAYIRGLGLSEQSAFYIQAILFWIAHHKFLSLHRPYSFWVAVPIGAILFGLMIWRSKSLTPSMIGHFLFNFITALLNNMF